MPESKQTQQNNDKAVDDLKNSMSEAGSIENGGYDSRKLFFKNKSKTNNEKDVKRFAFNLTNVNAVSSNLHEEQTNSSISTKSNLTKYEYVKPFSKNEFLKILLNGRNQQWQQELYEMIKKKENVSIAFDEINFKVTSNTILNIPFRVWSNKINNIISDYFKEFNNEIVKYEREQYQEIVGMMDKIEETRKLYPIDCSNKLDSNILFLMGRKMHIEDFYERNESFKKFRVKHKPNVKASKPDDNYVKIIKSVNIPELKAIVNKNGLINLLMPKLVKLKKLNEYTLNVDANLIELTGPKRFVEHTIYILKSNLPKMRCKNIAINLDTLNDAMYRNEITQINNNINTVLNFILDQEESTKSLIFKLDSNLNNNRLNSTQLNLTYFFDFVEINSTGHTVYDQINKVLNDKFALVDVDVSNYSSFFEDSKWKQFEQQNLSSLAFENKLFYSIAVDKQSGMKKILLYGIKDYIDSAKIKIDGIFSSDQFKTITISISEDDVIILILI